MTFYVLVFTDKRLGHEGRYVFSFEAWGNLRGLTFKTKFFEAYETVEALMAVLSTFESATLDAFNAMQKSLLGH